MRGKVGIPRNSAVFDRITPAYAGKSWKIDPKAVGKGNHPRLCGEKLRLPIKIFFPCGSPPPMRGKVKDMGLTMSAARITPAYAGKSLFLQDILHRT